MVMPSSSSLVDLRCFDLTSRIAVDVVVVIEVMVIGAAAVAAVEEEECLERLAGYDGTLFGAAAAAAGWELLLQRTTPSL